MADNLISFSFNDSSQRRKRYIKNKYFKSKSFDDSHNNGFMNYSNITQTSSNADVEDEKSSNLSNKMDIVSNDNIPEYFHYFLNSYNFKSSDEIKECQTSIDKCYDYLISNDHNSIIHDISMVIDDESNDLEHQLFKILKEESSKGEILCNGIYNNISSSLSFIINISFIFNYR